MSEEDENKKLLEEFLEALGGLFFWGVVIGTILFLMIVFL